MPRRALKQAQKRLHPGEVAELVAEHEGGVGVKKLAARFGVHRDTVHNILQREGVLRRVGIQAEDLPEVIRRYEAGWSLAQLGAELDVAPGTVSSALRKADVAIRRPAGKQAPA